ncbi:hypothetical protein HXX76_001989 [Chlamydomonas incerta]|uniref:Uncharacterized protein n=1 Tax=Chlamydomonas incerta TaxID=51695 RepID=A0A835WA72_CHLIN|nr:hypothetical protein HXX76_001989 [Chlamydomonas incerta]|eukprot:KAG2443639.1 hypothetical protein HXX76_001989 [Chlamydomonas incerta]
MLGVRLGTGPPPPPSSTVTDVERKLNRSSEVEINASLMSRDELIELGKKLVVMAPKITSLKILCVPKGVTWSTYHYSHMQDRRSHEQYVFATPEHKTAVKVASANVQHHLVRVGFYKAICSVLRRAPIHELVLGLRFSESGYVMLGEALAASKTLRRLSFAGSHMGLQRLQWLKPGLTANNSLEELDLTACGLGDVAAQCVAAVIKSHADRRQSLVFDEQLRLYPDASGLVPQHAAHLAFAGQLRAIAASVDERCGGLLHLELAENKMTDRCARFLRTALSYDRRLIFLSLRANKLSAEAEAEFISLMKEHQALLRVDLRQNADPQLGILKLKRRVAPRIFSAALGFQPNPLAPLPGSPALTETSMPLWALRDELPQSLGPTPMASPAARPVPGRPGYLPTFATGAGAGGAMVAAGGMGLAAGGGPAAGYAPGSPSRMSTVSWGDAHLLTRGSPRHILMAARQAAAAGVGTAQDPSAAAAAAAPGSAPPGYGGAAVDPQQLQLQQLQQDATEAARRRAASAGQNAALAYEDGGVGVAGADGDGVVEMARQRSLSAPVSPLPRAANWFAGAAQDGGAGAGPSAGSGAGDGRARAPDMFGSVSPRSAPPASPRGIAAAAGGGGRDLGRVPTFSLHEAPAAGAGEQQQQWQQQQQGQGAPWMAPREASLAGDVPLGLDPNQLFAQGQGQGQGQAPWQGGAAAAGPGGGGSVFPERRETTLSGWDDSAGAGGGFGTGGAPPVAPALVAAAQAAAAAARGAGPAAGGAADAASYGGEGAASGPQLWPMLTLASMLPPHASTAGRVEQALDKAAATMAVAAGQAPLQMPLPGMPTVTAMQQQQAGPPPMGSFPPQSALLQRQYQQLQQQQQQQYQAGQVPQLLSQGPYAMSPPPAARPLGAPVTRAPGGVASPPRGLGYGFPGAGVPGGGAAHPAWLAPPPAPPAFAGGAALPRSLGLSALQQPFTAAGQHPQVLVRPAQPPPAPSAAALRAAAAAAAMGHPGGLSALLAAPPRTSAIPGTPPRAAAAKQQQEQLQQLQQLQQQIQQLLLRSGGGAAAAEVSDAARQAAFLSMLHRERMAAPPGQQQADYNYLFTGPAPGQQQQQPYPQVQPYQQQPYPQLGGPDAPPLPAHQYLHQQLDPASYPFYYHGAAGGAGGGSGGGGGRSPASTRRSGSRSRSPGRGRVAGRSRSKSSSRSRSRGAARRSRSGSRSRSGGRKSSRGRGRTGRRLRAKRKGGRAGRRSRSPPAELLSATHPDALLVLERALLEMAAEVDRLEAEAAVTAALQAQEEAEAARLAAEAGAQTSPGQGRGRDGKGRKAGRHKQTQTSTRRERSKSRERKAAAAAKAKARRKEEELAKRRVEEDAAEALRRRIASLSSVKAYAGSARGGGINVNTIISQLDRWCSLCDDALLQPQPK